MFQWPLIVVLAVSMFVGRVCPVLQKEHHDDEGGIVIKGTNNASVVINNVNKTDESSTNKTVEDKKGEESKIQSPASLKNLSKVESPPYVQQTIDGVKHNCPSNSTKEAIDMTTCYVVPPDDDDDEQNSTTTESTNTTVVASNKTETSTESQVVKVTPQENKAKESGKTTETVVPLNHSGSTDKISYDVVSTEADHSIHTTDSVSDTVTKQSTDTSESSVNSIAPLLADNTAADIVGPVKSLDKDNNKHMPSGLIALVTAISFAVAIAIVYIGMIIWRRYIEYRYGHRELLVNELEFDTNDLRHFEL